MMRTYTLGAALLLFAVAFPATAQDDVHPELGARYSLDVGMFFPERSMTLGANLQDPGSRSVDFGGEFDLDKKDQTGEIDLHWRFGEKWSLTAQHFQASGTGRTELEEDVEWNGVVFARGSNAEAATRFSLYRLFFGRSFDSSEKTDFGIGGGLHWLKIRAEVEGSIYANNTVTFARESVSASAPLPNIGAWYTYSLSPRWALKARVDWFSANIDEYDGLLLNLQAGVDFAWFKHGGIGVAYNYVELDVDINNAIWKGTANVTFEGPFAFVSFYW